MAPLLHLPAGGIGSADVDRVLQDRKDLVLHVPTLSRGSIRYVVRSLLPTRPPCCVRWSSSQRLPRWSVKHPASRGRIRSRSGCTIWRPDGPAQHGVIARGIRDYLRSGPFEYTLIAAVPRRVRARGSRAKFLFVNRRGHCEYFASAMTVLCQAVVSGPGWWAATTAESSTTWVPSISFGGRTPCVVEVYLRMKAGWPLTRARSPPQGADAERRVGRSSPADARFCAIQVVVARVSFDMESRQDLADRVRDWLRRFAADEGEPRSFWGALQHWCGTDMLPLWQRCCTGCCSCCARRWLAGFAHLVDSLVTVT